MLTYLQCLAVATLKHLYEFPVLHGLFGFGFGDGGNGLGGPGGCFDSIIYFYLLVYT